MTETEAVAQETADSENTARIYEAGYTLAPTIKEEDVEKTVGAIRAEIERSGGNFIAEGAPSMTRLAYGMSARAGRTRAEHDRGYFGWIKCELDVPGARSLERSLAANEHVMRHIVFRTVREDTRAKMKAPVLREVKRTDTIKPVRRVEEAAGPVSEVELEKALETITAE